MKGITFLTIIRFTAYLLARALPLRALGTLALVVVTVLFYNKLVYAEARIFGHRPSDSTETEYRSLIEESEPPALHFVDEGVASWYGPRFHGRRTACGERYDMHDFTAAHPTLPFGTIIRVTNLATMQSTLARVNDRGPYVGGRVIDVSYGVAKEINLSQQGVGDVKIEVLSVPDTMQLAVVNAVVGERHRARVEPVVTAIDFSPEVDPLVVKTRSLRVLEEKNNLRDAIKTWKKLRGEHKNVYLVAQKTPAEENETEASPALKRAASGRNKGFVIPKSPYSYRLAVLNSSVARQSPNDNSDD